MTRPHERRDQRQRELLARVHGATSRLERAAGQFVRAAAVAGDAFAAVLLHIQPITIERGSDHAKDE